MATDLDLGKMVGPLPLGAWVAVVGGGLGFAIYTRRQTDIAPASSESNVLTPEDGSGIAGVGVGGDGFTTITPPNDGTLTQGPPQSNDEWGQRAVNWLIAEGYNAAVSDSAIRKYLDQERGYSSQEFALVTLALAHFGSPPTPLPAPVFGKPPTHHRPSPHDGPHPPHGHKPPKFRTYIIKPGDTLASIAKKFYHRADEWHRIYNANNAGQRRADGSQGFLKLPRDQHGLTRHAGRKLIIPN